MLKMHRSFTYLISLNLVVVVFSLSLSAGMLRQARGDGLVGSILPEQAGDRTWHMLLLGFMNLAALAALALSASLAWRNSADTGQTTGAASSTGSGAALRRAAAGQLPTHERMRQAESLAIISDTMRGLAHESRNALQQSQACLELLALKSADRPEIQELVTDIQKGLDHVLRLYDEVRKYAAPIQLKPQGTDLGELLQNVWQEVSAKHQELSTRLDMDTKGINLLSEVDRHALSQVFHDVLDHSLSSGNGPIVVQALWVEVKKDGAPAVQLRLRDNGPNQSPEARQRLFEPFFNARTRGAGLGLAIARRLINAHNGQIAVNGEIAGGTEIVITLPRNAS